jgi:hypothetical protein
MRLLHLQFVIADAERLLCVFGGMQSHFLTERDAWAGDLSELLTEPSPRTDTPVHFPDAHAPQKPFLPPFPIPGTPPPPPPGEQSRFQPYVSATHHF